MDSELSFKINAPKVIHETFEDEKVVINLDTGNYYSMDKTGSEIFGLIEAGATVPQVKARMAQSYKCRVPEMENSVDAFIAELQKEQLIVVENSNDARQAASFGTCTQANPDPAKTDFKKPSLEKFTDMQELLILDPIHEVDERGWPSAK